MNIIIRQAVLKDAPYLVKKEQEIAKEPGYFCSEPAELTCENVEKMISKLEKTNKGIYLVAEYEKQIVGHAFLEAFHLRLLSHVALLTIAVHKGWQEKGIGTKLMEKLIEWAKNSDTIEKIELNVRSTNKRAIALYKKMGFYEEGRLKKRLKINDTYIDDIVMALEVQTK